MHQGGRQVEASPHPARVRADAPAQGIADVDQRAQLGQPLVDVDAGQAIEAALKPKQLL